LEQHEGEKLLTKFSFWGELTHSRKGFTLLSLFFSMYVTNGKQNNPNQFKNKSESFSSFTRALKCWVW